MNADKALELARLTYPNDEDLRVAYMLGLNAGAKWQVEQDTRDMFMSDNRHFNKVYELGKNDMKEEMLNDAVEGEVYKFGEVAYVKERNNAELTKHLSQFNNGDKVKIIVIHETDI